jgi:hypothetical protein
MVQQDQFTEYLYGKLPAIYREEDSKLGLPLYRYITALVKGGLGKTLKDSNDFLKIIDPESCSEEFFRIFYESFGYKYFEDIDIKYQRKFLSNIGGIAKRRGSYASIRYIIRVLTGLEVDLVYNRVYNGGVTVSRDLTITLLANSIKQIEGMSTSVSVIGRFLENHVPFYVTLYINTSVATQVLKQESHRKSVITQYVKYNLIP